MTKRLRILLPQQRKLLAEIERVKQHRGVRRTSAGYLQSLVTRLVAYDNREPELRRAYVCEDLLARQEEAVWPA